MNGVLKYRPWQTKVALVDLLIVSFEGRQFLLKMLLEKPALRLVAAGSIVLFGLATSAMADISPIDPHALFATGGDATDIGAGQPITLSSPGGGDTGGGIFVFTNNTGDPLSAVEVDLTLPIAFLNGFSFTGTIFSPGPGTSSTTSTILTGKCDDPTNLGFFCFEMTFASAPEPIVPLGGNFVLDFDKPASPGPPPIYGGVDANVADGTYEGTTDTSTDRVGEWTEGAQGFVTPILQTPEPRQYAGLLAGIFALAIFMKRKRYSVSQ